MSERNLFFRGDRGVPGAAGPRGVPGMEGPTGKPGSDGKPGPSGLGTYHLLRLIIL